MYKLFCKKFFSSDEVKMVEKACKQLTIDLDICQVINKLKELEKFKGLFLSKDQATLFNFFPKPVIQIDDVTNALSRAEITE